MKAENSVAVSRDNVVWLEDDLSGFGASCTGAEEAIAHGVVEVSNRKDAKIHLPFIPQVGVLKVDVYNYERK